MGKMPPPQSAPPTAPPPKEGEPNPASPAQVGEGTATAAEGAGIWILSAYFATPLGERWQAQPDGEGST